MRTKGYIALWLLLTASLLAACSGDDAPAASAESQEIRFNADIWQVMSATRATTFDGGTLTSGSFTASAYYANTTTEYISPVQVNWVTDEWVFSDGKHFWPAGNLDFFAYMPATKPDYISSITYAVSGEPAAPNPYFTCADLPMTNSGQSSLNEFVYALETGQNKTDNASGVELSFKRPFALIKLQLSDSQADIHINTITLKSLKTGGTCSFNGSASTWSSLTPAENSPNFVATLNSDYSANGEIGTYIMVPQSWAGEIEVNASWTDWGESLPHTLSATIPAHSWAAGTRYTYTFDITETDLKVSTTKFTEQW